MLRSSNLSFIPFYVSLYIYLVCLLCSKFKIATREQSGGTWRGQDSRVTTIAPFWPDEKCSFKNRSVPIPEIENVSKVDL